MWFQKNRLYWRIMYSVFCVGYLAWVIYQGLDNFDMVHSEYQRTQERLRPGMVKEIALRELVARCRSNAEVAREGDCLSWPAVVLEEKFKEVEARLVDERKRAGTKLVLFYVFFVAFFCILPPVFLYLVLLIFFWIFRSIERSRVSGVS